MIGGKRHIGLEGYPPKPADIELFADIAKRVADHQEERPTPLTDAESTDALLAEVRDFTARSSSAISGTAPSPAEQPWVAGQRHLDEAVNMLMADMAEIRQRDHAADPQFARSLLGLTERLDRIEKQIAFMSSAQAMQEKQLWLQVRTVALDQAIKAAQANLDADTMRELMKAFIPLLAGNPG